MLKQSQNVLFNSIQMYRLYYILNTQEEAASFIHSYDE